MACRGTALLYFNSVLSSYQQTFKKKSQQNKNGTSWSIRAMMMDAASTFSVSVCCIPEGGHLHTRHRENLKSHKHMKVVHSAQSRRKLSLCDREFEVLWEAAAGGRSPPTAL
jgi:hypothetical protein